MSHKQLRDEVISIFLAGHDTTAISLSWTAHLLSKHPEIKAKMLAEIDSVLQGRAPTYADLDNLTYTRWVLKEGMRLHPAAYLTGRDSIEDVQIGDYMIPKGSTVFVSPAVMHRLPEYFPDPDAFKPERWEGVNDRDMKYKYIPFGGGPRVCIGEHFLNDGSYDSFDNDVSEIRYGLRRLLNLKGICCRQRWYQSRVCL